MRQTDRRSVGYQTSEPAGYQRKLAESWLHSSKLQTVSPHQNTVGGLLYYRIAMRKKKRDGDFPLGGKSAQGNWGLLFLLLGVVVV